MTRTQHLWRPFAAAVALALAACSSPNPVLYTIGPVSGPIQRGAPRVVVVRQVSTARYLERSEIVRSSANYRLDVMSNDWWGEPLSPMLARLLIADLGQRLPQTSFLGETGAVSAAPDATLEVNVQRLDEDATGNLVLQAQADVTFKGRPGSVPRSFRFAVPAAAGTPGEVAAISTAVGQLADGLVPMLTAR
jgi:uncharacterized lipoprotein YmbA